MEVEAKFTLPDQETFNQLLTMDHLAGYALTQSKVKIVEDQYLDTAARQLLNAGYACRCRFQPDGIVMTLKGLGSVQGAIHQREEWEIALAIDQPPQQWPDSPIRKRVLDLIGETPLQPLFSFTQTRTIRQINLGNETVAELSLDEVQMSINQVEHSFLELEIEQKEAGSKTDLIVMARYLQTEWLLEAESRSKFERALSWLDQEGLSKSETIPQLSPTMQLILEQIAAHEKDNYSRRATALLALSEGASTREAGEYANLSPSRVRYWRSAYRKYGLKIFPEVIVSQYQPTPSLTAIMDMQDRHHPLSSDKALAFPSKIRLTVDDAMADAAYKVLQCYWQRLLYYEAEVKRTDDRVAWHQMYIAACVMQTAFQIFGNYLVSKVMLPYSQALRKTEKVLAPIRDLDVFWEKTQHYQADLPPAQRAGFDQLTIAWQKQRQRAYKAALKHLESNYYHDFKDRFNAFLQAPEQATLPATTKKGFPRPHRLRDILPVLLYQGLAEIQAYDELIMQSSLSVMQLGKLWRIWRHFQYTLSLFGEILPTAEDTLLHPLQAFQTHLDTLQNAYTATQALRTYLACGHWETKRPKKPDDALMVPLDPEVIEYLARRERECQHLIASTSKVWADFKQSAFRKTLAQLVASL